MVRPLLLSIAAAFIFSGCASHPYQSKGLMGGYHQQRGPGNMDLVTFISPGDVNAKMAQVYATYRCAEIAKQHNSPWFAIYESLGAAAAGAPSKFPTVVMETDTLVASAFLMLLDGPRKNAYNTDEVLTNMKKVIETGKRD